MANDDNPRSLFAKLGEFIKRVFTGKEAEERFPAEVPKSTDELRRLIIENERTGVNVNEALRLYEKARDKEREPEEAARFIERAYSELIRRKYLKRISGAAFNYSAAIAILVGISLVILFSFKEVIFAPEGIFGVPRYIFVTLIICGVVIATIYLLKGLINSCIRVAAAKREELEFLERVPTTTAELRKLIIRYERRGVNVERAWRLYDKAVDYEARGKPDESERGLKFIGRAFSDLSRKRSLKNISRLAIFASVVFCLIAVVGAILLYFQKIPCDDIVLGVPLFIVLWGLIGSASYLLLMENRAIRRGVLGWFGFFRYLYRIALGGVMAAVTFYVVQLGVVSLPGVTGEEVKGAMERAVGAEIYRDALGLVRLYKPEAKGYEEIVKDFEEAGGPGVKQKYDVLEKYRARWEMSKPRFVMAVEGRETEVKELDFNRVKAEWEAYYGVSTDFENNCKIACTSILAGVAKKHTKDSKIYRDINSELTALGGDTKAKYKMMLEREDLFPLEIPIAGGETFSMTIEGIRGILVNYEYKIVRPRKNLENMFYAVNEKFVNDVNEAHKKLGKAERDVEKYQVYFESDELERQISDLRAQIENKMKEKDDNIAAGATDLDIEKLDNAVAMMREEMADLEEKLNEARRTEGGREIWKSPLFIVIAFLSGYSVEFSNRLINRIMEAVLPPKKSKPEKGRPEEEGEDEEPYDGGEPPES